MHANLRYWILGSSLCATVLATSANAQTFTRNTTQIPASSGFTESVAFDDVDDDGDLDAVFAQGGDFGNQQNTIWLNQGYAQAGTVGFFANATTTNFPAVLDDSRDIEFVDIDSDGDDDLYISNTSTVAQQTNRWWVNMGNSQGGTLGTFQDQTQARWLDIGVNDGTTTFSSVPHGLVLVSGGFIDWSCFCAFADLDNDGDMDLFHSTYGGGFFGTVPSRVFLNDSTGHYEEFNPSGFQLPSTQILNGDPAIWCEGTFQQATTNTTGQFCDIADTPLGVELGDLDGDFDVDVLQGARNEVPRIFQNRLEQNGGTLSFRDVSHAYLPANWAPGGGHYEQELGDMDNDGDLDIYGLNWSSICDTYFKNNGNGTYTAPVSVGNSSCVDDNEPEWLDFNNDGYLDVFVANFSGQDRLYQNSGPPNYTLANVTSTGLPSDNTTSLAAASADLDQDGDQDIFVANDGNQAEWFLKNNTNTVDTFAPYVPNLEQAPDRTAGALPTVIRAHVYDNESFFITARDVVNLNYQVNGGGFSSVTMHWAGGQLFRGEIDGTLVGTIDYFVDATDKHGNQGSSATKSYTGNASGCATPTTYCTAKVNSVGCTPAIGFTGLPSASAGSGFDITATNVINNKSGLLFYGTSGQAGVPFQGGYLCVKAPVVRTAVQGSGGNPPPNDCSGTYTYDFNVRIASGADANLVSGAVVNVQYWARDPGFNPPNNTSLTEGLNFTICP